MSNIDYKKMYENILFEKILLEKEYDKQLNSKNETINKPSSEKTKEYNKKSYENRKHKKQMEQNKTNENSNTKYTVLQLDVDGNIINKFFGCTEAGKYIGTTKENINMCCNGKRKTAKGYIWKYEII